MRTHDFYQPLLDAFECGAAAARHDVVPGSYFRSAIPAAEEHGYERYTPEYGAFIAGYISAMPAGGVRVDEAGRTLA